MKRESGIQGAKVIQRIDQGAKVKRAICTIVADQEVIPAKMIVVEEDSTQDLQKGQQSETKSDTPVVTQVMIIAKTELGLDRLRGQMSKNRIDTADRVANLAMMIVAREELTEDLPIGQKAKVTRVIPLIRDVIGKEAEVL